MRAALRNLTVATAGLVFTALFCGDVRASMESPPAVDEHALKAALTYKLARYVEWPATAFGDSNSPFVMCVVGSPALSRAFKALEKHSVHGRPLSVRRMAGDSLDLRRCHLVFFGQGESRDAEYAFASLQTLPVLTIGDAEDFADHDGIIALRARAGTIGFVINLPSSKRAGLVIRSQLLQLAQLADGGMQ